MSYTDPDLYSRPFLVSTVTSMTTVVRLVLILLPPPLPLPPLRDYRTTNHEPSLLMQCQPDHEARATAPGAFLGLHQLVGKMTKRFDAWEPLPV